MKRRMNLMVGVVCALLAGTVMAEDNEDPVWQLITPQVTIRPNKYGDDVPEITGCSTSKFANINEAIQTAKSGSTILLTRDLTFAPQNVLIKEDKIIAIDLNGYAFNMRSERWSGAWRVIFECPSNAVLSISNGSISNDLEFITQGTKGVGSVVLGPDLITDGNIDARIGLNAENRVEVILEGSFENTYTNVFNTEAQFLAMQGAKFACQHNPDGVALPGKLKFPSSDLQLVMCDDGTYVVGEPVLDKIWDFSLSHWMDDLPDDTLIYKICLPSSHDSGMSGRHMGDVEGSWARTVLVNWNLFKTQSYDIGEQLMRGTRVFDIRTRARKDKNASLRTYHGMSRDSVTFAMYGEDLDHILNSVDEFLSANPGEFVILCFSHFAKANGSDEKQAQEKTINAIKAHKIFDRMFKCEGAVKGQKDTWPMLNDVTLEKVRGKVIVLFEPEDGTEMETLDPANGIWGIQTGKHWKYRLEPGYYGVYDHYAEMDTLSKMKSDQLGKWQDHTKTRNQAEEKGGKTTAFSLDWTCTFSVDESLVKNPIFHLSVAAGLAILTAAISLTVLFFTGHMVAVAILWKFVAGFFMALGMTIVGLGATVYPLWRTISLGRDVEDMEARTNRDLIPTLTQCLERESSLYRKPSMVSIDYVSETLNRGIVALNADLCPYAAEVVKPDGTVAKKYEQLNDAFTNELLSVANNGCVVRLLRTEAPNDKNGFVVPDGYYVRFDLNGKRLQCGYGDFANKSALPLLTNRGHLEIFNSKPESGGFGGERSNGINTEGHAIKNVGNGNLHLKGVRFIDIHNTTVGNNSIIDNSGQKVVLVDVTLEPKCASLYDITQTSGVLYLTNCTFSAALGCSVYGRGGAIEMYGGCLGNNAKMPVLTGNCLFTLKKGEIKSATSRISPPFAIQDRAKLVVEDGFVGAGQFPSLGMFTVSDDAKVKVYNGCFAKEVPKEYIDNGVSVFAGTFLDYPFEVVPCGPSGDPAVARIVETQIKYPTVQAAVSAVKGAGGIQTVELLCSTHPAKTIVVPAETGVTLDLKGHMLVKRGTEEPAICNYGGLTLTDTSTNGQGAVSAFAAKKNPGMSAHGGIIYNAGTLFVAGGEIREGLAAKGGGIYNETNGICFVESGVVAECRATEFGGGIYNGGQLILRGGQIAQCTADKSGGGIWNMGELKVRDGAILACTAPAGGGLANARNAALFGGVIADNISTNGVGAGIYADKQTETMICGAWVKDLMAVSSTQPGTARVRIFEGYFGEKPQTAWYDDASALAVNDDPVTSADYPYVVRPKAVAEVDGGQFGTLDDALRLTIGEQEKKVRLLSHIRNLDTVLPEPCNVVLDLAGHWILGCDAALTLRSSSRLRIVDSVGGGTVSCLFATNAQSACSIRNEGVCRIEGGRYVDPIDNRHTMSVKAGLFSHDPDAAWIVSSSNKMPNEDELTRYEYPFAVVVGNNAFRAEEPTNLIPLQETLNDNDLTGESLKTVQLAEDSDFVSVTVREGHRAVLDLCGRRLHGMAHRPVITVERGAALTIVDSVGGGLILKGDVNHNDPELQGGIVNYGDLTLAGGMVSNCYGRICGGVYNASGATFVMSGGGIVDCGTTVSDFDSAPGVLNAGSLWMLDGEISGCGSVEFGSMAVCNLPGAAFNQLGGLIYDGFNGVEEGGQPSLVCYVWNRGRYVLVDGQVLELNGRQTGRPRECIYNAPPGRSSDEGFIQLWGTVTALGGSGDCAISCANAGLQDEKRIFRISNGMIDGQVGGLPHAPVITGAVSGGFFTTNKFSGVEIDSFCMWTNNTDAATRDLYPWRVVPQYEVEVLDSMGAVIDHCTLQQGFDYRNDQGVRLRLVTDVKDFVVCTNAAPVMLDLNGFAISGTGKTFADGFARSVIRNEGALTVYDSSTNRIGFIAMPSTGMAEEGGAICNYGALCVSNVVIFGTRAQRGGGVYNAVGAMATFNKVSMTGCQATDATSGDLICNEGALTLKDCTLEAWPDARNPGKVRRGLAIATLKTGQTEIVNCKVRGQITAAELAGGPVAVTIKSGLFDEEPPKDWVDDLSRMWKNVNDDTKYTYRWVVGGGQTVRVSADGETIGRMQMDSLYVRFGDGNFESVWWTGRSGSTRDFLDIPRDAEITLRAHCKSGDNSSWIVEKTLSLASFSEVNDYVYVRANLDLFFDAAIGEELFTTVSDALAAANGRVVSLFHNVVGDGHRLPAGKRAVLDLNGFILRGEGVNSVIVNEGELTLRDSSKTGTGQVVMFGYRFPKLGGGICNLGHFTLESGMIADCTAVSLGGGIYGSDRSVTYIRGGEIRGCGAEKGPSIYSLGRVEVSGGAICERMAFGKPQPNPEDPASAWKGSVVFVSGGIFGAYPQPSDLDGSWLAPSATVVANDNETTKDTYPYKVADTLACEPIYDVVRVDQEYFTDNPTVLAANRIYRFVGNVTLVGSTKDSTLASALSVTGGTTVLYIDAGVTVALTGSVAVVDGEHHPGAGLRVPEHATLIVTGEGTLLAKGSDPISGSQGGNGETEELLAYHGGKGGKGGIGMSAAIGGVGGYGGNGGSGGYADSSVVRGPGSGEAGLAGESMGRVVVLGAVKLIADADLAGADGGKCGSDYPTDFHAYGGGGGGGGGVTAFAIGGGAGGGGGGAGGGAGSGTAAVRGGFGGKGGLFAGGDGASTSDKSSGDIHGGAGGACGGAGAFYIGDKASIDCDYLDMGTNRVGRALNRHDALRRQISVRTDGEFELGSFEAFVGEPLPELNPDIFDAWGACSGLYFNRGDGTAELWYGADGKAAKRHYENEFLGDVTLYFRLDDDVTVAIIEDEKLGTRKFKTLAAAVAEADYGSTITIVGDATGENVKIPSGTTVRIGTDGKFRPPTMDDLLHDYYMVKTNFAGGKVVGYEYMLDADKVTPKVGEDSASGTPWLEFVVDEESGRVSSAVINMVNAYEDLYYGVDSGLSPTDLNPVGTWKPATERGSLRLEVPAAENGCFYRIRATDHVEGLLPDGQGYRPNVR